MRLWSLSAVPGRFTEVKMDQLGQENYSSRQFKSKSFASHLLTSQDPNPFTNVEIMSITARDGHLLFLFFFFLNII